MTPQLKVARWDWSEVPTNGSSALPTVNSTGHRTTRRPCAERVKESITPEIVPIVVPAGGGSFHHGRTWHGSGFNASNRPRRSLVVHAIPANVKFVREKIAIGNGPVYGRYMKLQDDSLDENFFPILWTTTGGRTQHLDEAFSA